MDIIEARFMQKKIRNSSSALLVLAILFALTGCNRPAVQSAQTTNATAQPAQGQQAPDQPNSAAVANAAPTLDNSNSSAPVATQAKPSAGITANGVPSQVATNNVPQQPLIVPAGTSVVVRLQQSLSSASSVPGERFDAVLDQPLVSDNQVIVPAGTMVTGHVTVARRSGRLHHPGEIGLTLDSVMLGQQRVPIVTSSVVARGGSHKKRNLGWIGGGTGGGALIGALAGGGKGALIGGGIGAAAGTTTALLTGKKDVGFGAERRLTFRLHRDLALQS
jgi:hypothetical protein